MCIVCGCANLSCILEKNGFRYNICQMCGTGSLDPLPDTEELTKLYDRGYFKGEVTGGYADYEKDERLHLYNSRLRLNRIEAAVKKGTIADIGCATGYFMKEARARGWEVIGVDLSEWARTKVQQRFGFEVLQNISALAEKRKFSFDVVCLSQVLEHDPHPEKMLNSAFECLKPGGLLFIETWDSRSLVARIFGSRWQQVSPPTVLYLFSKKSLDILLMRCGFHNIRYEKALKFVSLNFVIRLLGDRNKFIFCPSAAHGALRALHTVPLPYFFGDLIHVMAFRVG